MAPYVLYVEDEENDAYLVRLWLQKMEAGLPLHIIENGPQAIRYLSSAGSAQDNASHPLPCLVLLDLNLPGISGFEVLAWIRSQPRMKELAVVIFSSSNKPEDQERARELGANDYVVKPVDLGRTTGALHGLYERWIKPGCEVIPGQAAAAHSGGQG
jgi:CheY-like chemotaxis protein